MKIEKYYYFGQCWVAGRSMTSYLRQVDFKSYVKFEQCSCPSFLFLLDDSNSSIGGTFQRTLDFIEVGQCFILHFYGRCM